MNLNPADINISVFDIGTGMFPKFSGVKLEHEPTGIIVSCGTERGQHANKAKAWELLRIALEQRTDFTKQLELFNED